MAASMAQAPAFFNADEETWTEYMSKFRIFLQASNLNDASDDRKRAIFLHYCGPTVYSLASTLVGAENIESVPWASLQTKLAGHFEPTTPARISRNQFIQMKQADGESINDFATRLRAHISKCKYKDPEGQLIDRLISGMSNITLQKKYLIDEDATFQDVVKAAKAAEISEASVAQLRNPPSNIHQVDEQTSPAADLPPNEGLLPYPEDDSCFQIRNPQAFNMSRRQLTPCFGCNGPHLRIRCPFRDAICRQCNKRGHIAQACRSLPAATSSQVSQYTAFPPSAESQSAYRGNFKSPAGNRPVNRRGKNPFYINYNATSSPNKLFASLLLNDKPCKMEIDTGSRHSIMPWHKFRLYMPHVRKEQLKPWDNALADFQGNTIPIFGCIYVPVKYNHFVGKLPLLIVDGPKHTLLGLDWFKPLGMGITGVNVIDNAVFTSADLEKEFPEVFRPGLGSYKGTPISFNLDPTVAPIRLKPRRVPLPLLPKVDEQIDKLISQGILIPTDHSKWETPIVLPIKPDGSVRICADYRATLNKALQHNAYPIPVVQQLLHTLGNGTIFAKIDLAQAYQQLPVSEETAEAQTIVTHRGAFKCSRLQFGVSIAPGIFQSLMERLLNKIPGVVPYFDDVLISAHSISQLRERIRAVLTKFSETGLRIKPEKCAWAVPSVEFLGYHIDKTGIHPTESKVEAIQKAPTPTNKTELQAFLGLVNFYAIFLKQKATVAEPLHRLLKKGEVWSWGPTEQAAFQQLKSLLSSNSVLVQYNITMPVVLTCDASPFGIGAVLSHTFPDGTEAPIAFYSKTLSPAERNYSQLDKEALALVAGVRRFHNYLFGRSFTIITDHKPLLGLLAGDKPTPPFLSPRMTRWTIFLAAYNYVLKHKGGREIGHADALSRCPQADRVQDPAPASNILLIEWSESPLVTAYEIASETRKDPILSQVKQWILRGWPAETKNEMFNNFKNRQTELNVLKDCILWGDRVVIPKSLQRKVLRLLHQGHPGMVRMKTLARSHLWWPGLDKEIESWVASCHPCQQTRPAPPKTSPAEWATPKGPWSRIHIDFAGPIAGKSFLIVVDSYSKWLDVIPMNVTTTAATIRALRQLFSTHGIPDVLVSDNGPQLTSRQMELFLAERGIKHTLTSPHFPATNGRAERMVRLTKEALSRVPTADWQQGLDDFLLAQHITPSASTNKSPAELLMGRKLRSQLDRLHPEYTPERDRPMHQPERFFKPGDSVFAKNFDSPINWREGLVEERTGHKAYKIRINNGQIWHRHIDQLRNRQKTNSEQFNANPLPFLDSQQSNFEEPSHLPYSPQASSADRPELLEAGVGSAASTSANQEALGTEGAAQPPASQLDDPTRTELRRTQRISKPPIRLKDYVTWLSE